MQQCINRIGCEQLIGTGKPDIPIPVVDNLTVSGDGQTNFTLSQVPASNSAIFFVLNGQLRKYGTDYTVINKTLTWLDIGGLTLKTTDRISVYYNILNGGTPILPANTLLVAESGTDYNSIATAVNAASDGDVILIFPGTYIESPILINKQISLIGLARTSVIIVAADNNNPLFTITQPSVILDFMAISGPTNDSAIVDSNGTPLSQLTRLTIANSLIGIYSTGANSSPSMLDIAFSASIGTGFYSDATGSGGGALVNLQSQASISAQVDSGFLIVNAAYIFAGAIGIFVNGGSVDLSNIAIQNQTTAALRADNSSDVVGVNVLMTNCVQDIVQSDSASTIRLTSSQLDVSNVTISDWDNVKLDFDNTQSGDDSYTIAKELHVGVPEKGYESVFGQGDSYVRGMLVYTETPLNVFADVSAEARSASGSTFTFPGTAADNSIYVASSLLNGGDFLQHFGIKAAITTAAVLGAGSIVAEYWNGAAWTEFHHMSTESDGTYYPYAEAIFERTGSEQIRYNSQISTNWTKNDPVSLGTDYFWMRFRIATGITTAPIFEQFKLHSSRFEINSDGWIEYFGRARPINIIPWDWNLFQAAGNSPGNADLYALDSTGGDQEDLTVGRLENAFGAGIDRAGLCLFAPYDLDTSCPLVIRLTFIGKGTGNVAWFVNFGITRNGDTIQTSGGPTSITAEQHLEKIVAIGAIDQQVSTEIEIDVSEVIPRRASKEPDILWISIAREQNVGNDTIAAAVDMVQISPVYTQWSAGSHQ